MPDMFNDWTINRRLAGTSDNFEFLALIDKDLRYYDDTDAPPNRGAFEYQLSEITTDSVDIPYNLVSLGTQNGLILSSDQYETFLGIFTTDSTYLLSVNRAGTVNRLTWTWPARFVFGSNIDPLGLYLQRSEISMNPRRYPLVDNVYTVTGTAPDTEPGWSTIHSWTGTALNDRPNSYDDVIVDTKVYAYRLCLIVSRGGTRIEIDWNVCLRVPPVIATIIGSNLTWNSFDNAAGDLRPAFTVPKIMLDGEDTFSTMQMLNDGETSFPIDLNLPGTTRYQVELYFSNYTVIDWEG